MAKADFTPSESQVRLEAAVGKLVEAGEIGHESLPGDTEIEALTKGLAAVRGAGLAGITYPRDLGGQGLGWQEHASVLAAMALDPNSIGYAYHLQQIYPRLLLPEQAALAGPAIRGEQWIALAHREPHSTGDVFGVETTAVRDGSDYVITGHKSPVLLGPGASHLIVSATTAPDRPYQDGTTLFAVPTDRPGVTIEPQLMRLFPFVPVGSVALNGVRVPANAVVGEEHHGYQRLGELWPLLYGMSALFEIRSALEAVKFVVEDSKQKITFGRALIKWQAVQFRLMDAQYKLELTEPMAWYFAWMQDQGLSSPDPELSPLGYGSLLHYLTAKHARKAFEDAAEIGGGRMFNEGHPVWQRYMSHVNRRALDPSEEFDRAAIAHELWGEQFAPALV